MFPIMFMNPFYLVLSILSAVIWLYVFIRILRETPIFGMFIGWLPATVCASVPWFAFFGISIVYHMIVR